MTALLPGQLKTFDAFSPIQPGTYSGPAGLEIAQEVTDKDGVLVRIATSTVALEVVAPAVPLPPDAVIAVYPPAGAEDATDVMLPHVVLKERALPWAHAPTTVQGASVHAWLAVALFHPDDGADFGVAGQVTCARARLDTILPRPGEVDLLCHVRELPADDPLAARDDDRLVALVVGPRLPKPKAECTAVLVDVRPYLTGSATPVTLPILHRWDFKTGAGGDFQAYFARLREPSSTDPTGGVRAFGQSIDGDPLDDGDGAFDLAAPRPDEPTRRVRYAGPLAPFARDRIAPPAVDADADLGLAPDGVEVVGHAVAFELGRLLALASQPVLDALLGFRESQFMKDLEPVLETPVCDIPGVPIPFKGDPRDVFRDTTAWFGDVRDDLWKRTADPTGILDLVGRIPGLDATRLAKLGGLQIERRLATMTQSTDFADPGPIVPAGMPTLGGIVLTDPGLGDILTQVFADLPAAIAAQGLAFDTEVNK